MTSLTRLSRSMVGFSKPFSSPLTYPGEGPTTPGKQVSPVWAVPLSLATTYGITFCFLLLGLLRCFTSPRLASLAYTFNQRWFRITGTGFPHSEIHGSMPACGSPWLIATCYVLHRLLVPRHSPFALSSLITKYFSFFTTRSPKEPHGQRSLGSNL